VAVAAGVPTAEPEPENPLTAGLERLPVAPTTLVLFGATAIFARRKLLRRFTTSRTTVAARALPPRGSRAQGKSARGLPPGVRGGDRRFSRGARPTRTCSRACSRTSSTCGTSTTRRLRPAAKRSSTASRSTPASRSRAFFCPPHPVLPVIVRQLGRSKLAHHEGRRVRMIIEKPFGTTLEAGTRAQPLRAVDLRRAQVFPHRPTNLGKGIGAEHDGVSASRTACSSRCGTALHRQRADHGREDLGIGVEAEYYDHAGALRT